MLTKAMTIRSAGGSCSIEGSAVGLAAGQPAPDSPHERRADIVTALLHLGCALICARKLQPL
jgi:hypothetical protein